MMQSSFKHYLFLICFLFSSFCYAKELLSDVCEPVSEVNDVSKEIRHSKGLLWKVSKPDTAASYIFGTIHVSDEDVTTLPAAVNSALLNSKHFMMEALPDSEQLLLLASMMFFRDGQRLSELTDPAIYNRTKEILAAYMLGAESVSVMKPWAAFLTMNYPPEQGEPLDLVLLSIAQQNGAAVYGLETLEEQGQIFNSLTLDEQVKLLNDTVCHYEVVEQDFNMLKKFYLKQDLAGLYNYAQRYSSIEEPVYKKLMDKLITQRNITMVDRMQAQLQSGSAFIAVGALHLAGEEGVLNLLEKQGYNIKAIF